MNRLTATLPLLLAVAVSQGQVSKSDTKVLTKVYRDMEQVTAATLDEEAFAARYHGSGFIYRGGDAGNDWKSCLQELCTPTKSVAHTIQSVTHKGSTLSCRVGETWDQGPGTRCRLDWLDTFRVSGKKITWLSREKKMTTRL